MEETLDDFYAALLEIRSPWQVRKVERNAQTKEVKLLLEYNKDATLQCPECGGESRLHDH